MTEKKYDNLLKISFAVLAVSAVMLCVSGYNLYFRKNQVAFARTSPEIETMRDSLQKVYAATVRKLDESFQSAWNNADTLSSDLDLKLADFNKLKADIASLLKDQSSATNLSTASEKIVELQVKVNALRSKNSDVEAENKRLLSLLQQLKAAEKVTTAGATATAPQQKPDAPITSRSLLTAGELRLYAVVLNDNKETETVEADKAEKLMGTFSVKNLQVKSNAEFVVVVLQPDGKVVRNSVWESGVFETNEGKKVYSRKINPGAGSGDRQFNFSLNPDRILKGEYIMQVWYNGSLVGKKSKVLS